MASEPGDAAQIRYLHPSSLLFSLARSARVFALPALALFFSIGRTPRGAEGSFSGFANLEYWLLLFLVPSAIIAIAKYLSFRLRYEDTELVIRSGILFRNERHVPYTRVQNLDAVQNLAHRLFDVVEVRVQTGSGKEPEATISVLPSSALAEMRRRVFAHRSGEVPVAEDAMAAAPVPNSAPAAAQTLLHLPPRELALVGFIDNRGLVVVGALYGLLWQFGLLDRFWRVASDDGSDAPGFVRSVIDVARSGSGVAIRYVLMALGGLLLLLVLVRVLSMVWAAVRLYDFRLIRVGDDLRTTFGLITREQATIPLAKVQTLTIYESPIHRLIRRVAVRVETAGGSGKPGPKGQSSEREWLAPIVRGSDLPPLLAHVVPGLDLQAVAWQSVHPRAFRRAVKPALVRATVLPLLLSLFVGPWGLTLLCVTGPVAVLAARNRVARLGWVTTDGLAIFRSGWLWRRITVARTAKIQVVTLVESPFDRRTAMAQVRVDTAGASDRSHRVRIPYLARSIAFDLHRHLSAQAAGSAFRW